MYEVHNMNA